MQLNLHMYGPKEPGTSQLYGTSSRENTAYSSVPSGQFRMFVKIFTDTCINIQDDDVIGATVEGEVLKVLYM